MANVSVEKVDKIYFDKNYGYLLIIKVRRVVNEPIVINAIILHITRVFLLTVARLSLVPAPQHTACIAG